MPSTHNFDPIHIGLVSHEPIRLAGLISVFDLEAPDGKPRLLPVPGTLDELLSHQLIQYLMVDLHSHPSGLNVLESIRRVRPSLRLIVIGPGGNDELILQAIIAGARAYLDLTAGPETVRMALEVVTGGSIWAPRRLLSKLIDRLLKLPDSSLTSGRPHLTDREQQVLDLILKAQPNREIARHLGIEERTVKAHVGRLMRKTGSDNRTELSMRALHAVKIPVHTGTDRRVADRRSRDRSPERPGPGTVAGSGGTD
jgi:DNA-binding NarL/FixJ family response regulator